MIDAQDLGLSGELHTAGTQVLAGRYCRIDGVERVIELPEGGVLPPSFDGQIAVYRRVAERLSL